MILTFDHDVYFVKGAIRSCIYDFRTNNLYHLTSVETLLLESLLGQEKSHLSSTSLNHIEPLLENGILVFSSSIRSGDIHHLSPSNQTIDFAWIEVTTRCNLRCIHCYDGSSPERKEEMDYTSFCLAVDNLSSIGVTGLQIIGGEPMILGDRLFQYLDYAIDKFDFVEIFTNGTLCDDKWFAYFREKKIHIALSVYSYNPSMHDKVTTVPGSFDKTNATIAKLKSNQIPYRIATVRMRDIDLGAQNTDLFHLNPNKDIVRLSGRGGLHLLSDDLLRRKLITPLRFSAPLNKKLTQRLLSGHNCFSRRVYISAGLNVYPCVMERRLCHGNLHDNTLKNLLNPDITTLGKDKITECSVCEFRYCCHDCRPDAISSNVYAKPWTCTYSPATGQWEDPDSFIEKLRE